MTEGGRFDIVNPMYLVVEENPNCSPDERVFSESGAKSALSRIKLDPPTGEEAWCEAAAVEEGGLFSPAHVVQVEDSSAGTAWLVYGGLWGVRFKPSGHTSAWSLDDKSQWGAPFLVLDRSTPLELAT